MFTVARQNIFHIVIFLILIASFFIRAHNLNYNSAFTDEATSIVIGRLGVFQGDWWSYNAFNWMSGNPVINPVLSGITYMTGGLTASRLLSVIFGVLTVETIAMLTVLLADPGRVESYIGGIFAGVLVAFSPVAIYISRLTTYDIKSFFFLFLSITILAWIKHQPANGRVSNVSRAIVTSHPSRLSRRLTTFTLLQSNPHHLGKWYFVVFVFLFFALLAKITVLMYIPFIVIYSFLTVRKEKEKRYYWLRYFLAPVVLIISAYMLSTLFYLVSFAQLQASKEAVSVVAILQRIYSDITYEIWYGALGALVLALTGKWKLTLSLLGGAMLVLMAHIVTQRAIWTMDKEVFISAAFFAMIAGLALTRILTFLKFRPLKIALAFFLCLSFLAYIPNGTRSVQAYNTLWDNSDTTAAYLQKHVQSGDKVLSETGTPIILALYDVNVPMNTNTFDWFEYQGVTTIDAYTYAVQDGYFNWIELLNEDVAKSEGLSTIHKLVAQNLGVNYKLVYSNSLSTIYKRTF